jgi:puromycin-sensitive aminopeptidase
VSDEYRLPQAVAPRSYRLTIEPDLEACTFRGAVEIDLEVRAATREITLNSLDLEILEATAAGRRLDVSVDASKERATLLFPDPVKDAASVAIRFSGVLSEQMRGFYRSRYTAADGSQRILGTTQFEATSARRAFPCFDEPAFKAAFDITMIVPEGRSAVSNMPVIEDVPAGDGRRRVRFDRTPVMSTYLLAFAVGEFESIQGRTLDGVPVRVLTTPGRSALGRFALDTAIRGLEFFDAYYGIPYRMALPKCDLLAIPDFEAGAMENWGAITFRETAIFIDPRQSTVPQLRRVAEVVLHELAHMWFGNLVSPEWWSYLWLNESFATFMAFKAADALFPEWHVWDEYLAQTTSAGFALDSLRSSHPVEVPVGNPNEVEQIFDAISYNKGGSVLRMLEHCIGERNFRDGIRAYLARHRFACATTDDLWRALGEQAGTDLRGMMDGWTRQTGVPVVLARRDEARLRLRQERFFLDRDPAAPATDDTLWDIPVGTLDQDGRRSAIRLATRETAIPAPPGWMKLNAGQTGFYLVHYDQAGWEAIAGALDALPASDRFGLQEDAYSLMRAGYLPVAQYLRFVGAFSREENHHVIGGLASAVRALAETYVGDPAIPRFEEWARELFRPLVAKVGWTESPNESHDRILLRSTVLGAAVHFGDPACVEEVRRRFAAARRDLGSLPPNQQALVFGGAARHGGDEELSDLMALYDASDLPETKMRLLVAMGSSRQEATVRRAIAFALSDRVRPQDAVYPWTGVPIEQRRTSWSLLKEHWETLDRRYGKSGMIGRFIQAAAGGIPDQTHAADVEAFFRDHPAPFATERIKQTLEAVRARAKFRARNANALEEFFMDRG